MARPRPPCFTADDLARAHADWGCNCGPGALAAIMGMTLDEVRPHLIGFAAKRYTNPTMMHAALRSIGRPYSYVTGWPDHGLCRIQWEGPWTRPGVPIRARYRHTHWVAAARLGAGRAEDLVVYDINAMANGSGWSSLADWSQVIVPWILSECVPRADGRWHITHSIEVAP